MKNPTQRTLRTYDPKKEHSIVAGTLMEEDGEMVFVKKVDPEKHFLKVIGGYAINMDIIKELVKHNCASIYIIEPSGATHKASLATWIRYGKRVNYGYGEQLGLRFGQMNEESIHSFNEYET